MNKDDLLQLTKFAKKHLRPALVFAVVFCVGLAILTLLTSCAPVPVIEPVVVGTVEQISTSDAYVGVLSVLNGDTQTLMAIRENVTAYMWKMGPQGIGIVIYDSQTETIHGLEIIDSSAAGKSVNALVDRILTTGFRIVDVNTIPADVKKYCAEGIRNLLLIANRTSTITIIVLPIAPGLDPSSPCLLYEVMGIPCQKAVDG